MNTCYVTIFPIVATSLKCNYVYILKISFNVPIPLTRKKKLPSKTYCHKQNPGYYINNKFKMITHSLLIISSKICNSMDVESKY